MSNQVRMFLTAAAAAVLVGCAATAPAPATRPERTASPPPAAREVLAANPEDRLAGAAPTNLRTAVTPNRGRAIRRGVGESGVILSSADAGLAANRRTDPLRVHVLNIGAGSCHIIECPNSSDVMLYDCGQMSPTDTDLSADQVAAYFANAVGSDEPVVVLSHADRDHVSLVAAAMGERTPQSVWFGGAPDDYTGLKTWLESVPADRLYFDWQPGWHERGAPVPELQCGDAETYLLTVNVGTTTNSQSLMLLVRYGNFSIVFSGDAVGDTERSAMQNHGTLLEDVTVLLGSHHGARTHESNHEEWARTTSPQVVIYSAGVSHGHPTVTAAERYHASLVTAKPHDMWASPGKPDETRYTSEQAEYTTELSGTIVITSDGSGMTLECSRQPACF